MNIAIIENNIVTNVIVCDSFELAKELTNADEVLDADEYGIGIGFTKVNDKWIPDKPYPSWIFNENWGKWGKWESPIPYPTDGNMYFWNEDIKNWVLNS